MRRISELFRPIRIKDLIFEYEKLIANNYYKISNEFHVGFEEIFSEK